MLQVDQAFQIHAISLGYLQIILGELGLHVNWLKNTGFSLVEGFCQGDRKNLKQNFLWGGIS